ncbi:23S rRNA pseudouridine(1911/1915/1917) synthase RluD [Zhongshania borealis]|jgi:23S rRNA pseudouridine1911/1915/1917 synthase|uniref:Pseudouridine synthase n=1 Tax=Zhongshania borealis TaxID=889488 RepID=A0ABP7X379_9GAMM|tara:strand:+ start:434 stop:1390 length:957 start_codon:yes stop_codon:yes gene_type:complete
MTEIIDRQEIVPAGFNGDRFDQVAAQLFPEYSRSRLQTWIKSGELTVNGEAQRTRDKVYEDDKLALRAELQPEVRWEAEEIELDIVYEDEHVLVINKPAGLVVHPGAGNPDGTLLNALLNHFPDIATVPRAGIVHRLDRDTTGLMIAAKTLEAHTSLVAQLQAREVHREYDAVVFGTMTGGGTVEEPMGRHPRQRTKMAVTQIGGKEAITHYRVTRRYLNHTHIRCFLETGRTHQIRVHMAHIKYPLIGDPLYAGRPRLPKGASETLITALRGFGRQALHARRLELEHPITGDTMSWEVPLPDDMKALIAVLSTEDVR